VIYHHRVIKTDKLLENAIISLTMDYLNEYAESDDSLPKQQALPLDISGLWQGIQEMLSDKQYFNNLIQWDDSWLLTVLRQQFLLKYQAGDGVVRYQLEELLSNRKYYRSIIKRMDDFLEIDKAVIKHFNVDWAEIEQTIGDNWNAFFRRFREMKNIQEDERKIQIPLNGFFVTAVKEFYETLTQNESEFESTVEKHSL
jgi:hypothetical protein